jgi:hypothetical protein
MAWLGVGDEWEGKEGRVIPRVLFRRLKGLDCEPESESMGYIG